MESKFKNYTLRTLESMRDVAKSLTTPQHSENDVAFLASDLSRIFAAEEQAELVASTLAQFQGNTAMITKQNAVADAGTVVSELSNKRDEIEQQIDSIQDEITLAATAKRDVVLLNTAIAERKALARRLRGVLGFWGAFGSSDKWSKEEAEFASAKLRYDSEQMKSISEREQFEALSRDECVKGMAAIKRWVAENEVQVACVGSLKLRDGKGNETCGSILYRAVQDRDGIINFTTADKDAKPLRLWFSEEQAKAELKRLKVKRQISVMRDKKTPQPDSTWLLTDNGNIQDITGAAMYTVGG